MEVFVEFFTALQTVEVNHDKPQSGQLVQDKDSKVSVPENEARIQKT
jgi:hypothetical protein